MAISNLASGLRTGVCTSTTRPTAPFNGQVIYETDSKQTLVWQGSAWVMLTDADQPPAMQLIKSQTFSGSDPLDITGVFTSEFRNYKALLQYYGSAASNTNLQFFTGTNTLYNSALYYRYGPYLATTGGIANFYAATQTEAFICNHATTSSITAPVELTFFSPQATDSRTQLFVKGFDPQSGLWIDLMHQVAATDSFTGFRLDAASGTISGTIRIYGYRD